MIKVLTDHLNDKVEILNSQIRDSTEKTFLKLRATAKLSVAQTNHLLAYTLGEESKKQAKAKMQNGPSTGGTTKETSSKRTHLD